MSNTILTVTNRQAKTETATTIKPVTALTRAWFYLDMFLVFVTGVQLFVLGEMTDQLFAWTIKSTLTAAFMGAAYWSTLPMLWNSARERVWANARIALPGVWVFTVLTSIATFQYWDKFHWNSSLMTAQFAFWVWLVVYVAVPVAVVVIYLLQRRVPGADPLRTMPLPVGMRVAFVLQAAVMLGTGAVLFFAPAMMMPLWAWTLTPLTGAALGAWAIGTGVTALAGLYENDWRRIRGAMITYTLFGILQLIAVARFAAQMDWAKPGAVLYVAFVLSILVVGAAGVYLAKRAGAFSDAV